MPRRQPRVVKLTDHHLNKETGVVREAARGGLKLRLLGQIGAKD